MKNQNNLQIVTSRVGSDTHTINTYRIRSVVVVSITGKLIGGPSVVSLRQTMADLVSASESYVVMNLQEVSAIDDSGVRAIRDGHATCEQQGGKFALVQHCRQYPATLLKEALTDKVTNKTFVTICTSEESAVDSMFQDDAVPLPELDDYDNSDLHSWAA
jgi:anti-anti-sigma regulatory factor